MRRPLIALALVLAFVAAWRLRRASGVWSSEPYRLPITADLDRDWLEERVDEWRARRIREARGL